MGSRKSKVRCRRGACGVLEWARWRLRRESLEDFVRDRGRSTTLIGQSGFYLNASSFSKKSGKVLVTQAGFWMRIPADTRPVTAKPIAIR